MDLPHQISKRVWAKLYQFDYEFEQFKIKKDLKKNDVDWSRFEVSFGMAFNLIMYIIIMLYSLVNPIITIVGALYFSIKYFFDKYNLTVVYPKNYDSKGDLGAQITYYNYLMIFFIQFIIFLLFTITLKQDTLTIFFIGSISFQVLLTFMFRMKQKFSFLQGIFAMLGNYMTVEEEKKLMYDQGLMDVKEMVEYKEQQ